jgi:hypothetical protein
MGSEEMCAIGGPARVMTQYGQGVEPSPPHPLAQLLTTMSVIKPAMATFRTVSIPFTQPFHTLHSKFPSLSYIFSFFLLYFLNYLILSFFFFLLYY